MANKSPLHRHGGGRAIVFRVMIAVLLVVAGYLVYEFGRIKAGYDIVDASAERVAFEAHIVGLDGQISDLKQEVAILKTDREVDREAYREVEAHLVDLQTKIQEQQDAIAFYRGIVSPADGNAGLRVQDFKLTRAREEREFNLRLVLIQAMKHDRKVSGNVAVTIAGTEDGADATYTFADIAVDEEDAAWPFSFRYFQDFERRLALPDGFEPESIKVEVRSRTRSISSIEENFAWATSQG